MDDVHVIVGDLCRVVADGICTSTNPSLALMIGTGGAVREAGGWTIQDACARLIASEQACSGKRYFPLGSAHLTTAGNLPFRGVIHCVASDAFHVTCSAVITSCVRNAVSIADREGWAVLAMPLFGTGHAAFEVALAADAIAEALATYATRSVQRILIVTRRSQHVKIMNDALSSHGHR